MKIMARVRFSIDVDVPNVLRVETPANRVFARAQEIAVDRVRKAMGEREWQIIGTPEVTAIFVNE